MNLTNSNVEQAGEAAPSRRARTAIAITAAAVATPIIAAVAGLDQFVLGRLAANHNEVAAADD